MAEFISNPIWQQIIFGNTIVRYVLAVGYFVVIWLAFKLIQIIILKRLKDLAKRTATEIDDILIKVVNDIRPSVYIVLAIYTSLRTLTINPWGTRIINAALLLVLVYQAVMTVQVLINQIVRRKLARSDSADKHTEAALLMVNKIARVVLWSLGALFVLSNFGINVTSLIAGLGIGGIAIALAAQNILGDLFSSLAIYLDKPFQVGDSIKVGNVMGKVRHIGIKTTRIKSLAGEEVIIPNKSLTNSQVQNYRRMDKRRVVLKIGVKYDTPAAKLQQIPDTIGEIIKAVEKTDFDRAHFKSFGDSALIFEVVYHVTSPQYETYMDVQEEVNLKINEKLIEQHIEFAYPTQTIHIRRD